MGSMLTHARGRTTPWLILPLARLMTAMSGNLTHTFFKNLGNVFWDAALSIDLFASWLNEQVNAFSSWMPDSFMPCLGLVHI